MVAITLLAIGFVTFLPSGCISLVDLAGEFGFSLWSDAVIAQTDTEVTREISCCVPDDEVDGRLLAGSMSSEVCSVGGVSLK